VKPRGEKPVGPDELRAAKLSHVPGVTIAEAAARFGVTKTAVARARKAAASKPTVAELALAALTANGTREAGTVAELDGVASWIDYINHDGATAATVRTLLAPFVAAGQLELDHERWRFTGEWP
jgi:hypothetical protein